MGLGKDMTALMALAVNAAYQIKNIGFLCIISIEVLQPIRGSRTSLKGLRGCPFYRHGMY
ncbi:MAG: hypothetical protein IKX58_08045 [Clostridia bacterium]|nr:hypothetical protein [Clostridia bacterium]